MCTLLSHVHLSCKELTLGKQGDKNQYDWKCNLEVLGCMLLDAHKSMHNAKMHKMPGKKKEILAKKYKDRSSPFVRQTLQLVQQNRLSLPTVFSVVVFISHQSYSKTTSKIETLRKFLASILRQPIFLYLR